MSKRRQLGLLVLTLLAAASAMLVAVSAWAQTFPALSGQVVDAANIIPPETEARLTGQLAALASQSQRQLVVVTVPSLEGYEVSDYGYRLGRHWGIGDKERNDGALLIIAPNDRKVRIEVGYGLEGIVTDGLSSLIIQNEILPKFREGDMPAGIEAGAAALITQLTLPEEEARRIAAEARPAKKQESDGLGPAVIFTLIFFFFILLPMLRRGRGRRGYSSGVGQVIVWEALNHALGNRGGGGWSSGGGSDWGGGGFSGGGGSFGGGGSSGSW